ncbi:DegT/DnrJ/EryC1/StrS family aminotransferase [Anatilimnocola floriformis]|uniref:DegT/DnrJ/EryC1/StrS family aminotransferase n=1 Tax=Anatilimnocola floriformis TaxID=2948575 RepID=UPI0020C4C772|nr:aminotransferase class V-fold PLP-dependent enzyme [Anatilimnocola floriformis]
MTIAFPGGPTRWPLPDEDVRAALLACYASGDWGRYDGANTTALTASLQNTFQREHVQLCSSGTIAVELALRGLRVGAGDEVILAAYDFPGNFRAIEAVGARPVLVDIAKDRWTIDVQQLAAAISPATKAVIVSHLHGDLADIEAICQLAKERNLQVLEDACQVPGAMISGRPIGSFGDASVLSFGGSKLLTAGRGGAVLTSQADVAQRIRVFSSRGNEAFPLSELQAAVLLPQMAKLAEYTRIRAESAIQLRYALRDLAELSPVAQTSDLMAYYKFAWRYLPAGGDAQLDCRHPTRDGLICQLQAQGIDVGAGFRGFNKRSTNRCRIASDLTNAQSAAETTLLLHHPILLQPDAIETLADAVRKVIAGQR